MSIVSIERILSDHKGAHCTTSNAFLAHATLVFHSSCMSLAHTLHVHHTVCLLHDLVDSLDSVDSVD